MPEPPKPAYGYKASPMNSDRKRMLFRLAGLLVFWGPALILSYGSLRGVPAWLWFAPGFYLFVWEFADMVWWNFQILHERIDDLEEKLVSDNDAHELPNRNSPY